VFSVINGVEKVEQGWIKSTKPYDTYSEAVIVHYNPKMIALSTLLKIHLETHSSTANHSMRTKYRSAVYYFKEEDMHISQALLKQYSATDKKAYITQVLPFISFKKNREQFLQYFEKNKNAPFCRTYIHPKISLVKEKFPNHFRKQSTRE
jgi:peptide-methionine (S)-S-oxide reductase